MEVVVDASACQAQKLRTSVPCPSEVRETMVYRGQDHGRVVGGHITHSSSVLSRFSRLQCYSIGESRDPSTVCRLCVVNTIEPLLCCCFALC